MCPADAPRLYPGLRSCSCHQGVLGGLWVNWWRRAFYSDREAACFFSPCQYLQWPVMPLFALLSSHTEEYSQSGSGGVHQPNRKKVRRAIQYSTRMVGGKAQSPTEATVAATAQQRSILLSPRHHRNHVYAVLSSTFFFYWPAYAAYSSLVPNPPNHTFLQNNLSSLLVLPSSSISLHILHTSCPPNPFSRPMVRPSSTTTSLALP